MLKSSLLICILTALLCVPAAAQKKKRTETPPTTPAKATEPTAEALTAAAEAAQVVVVYNEKAADSKALAEYYQEMRNIPKDHVIGLSCTIEESISRKEYDEKIANPLREIFEKRGWWRLKPAADEMGRVQQSTIRYVALIRGIPLKVEPQLDYPGDVPQGPAAIASHSEAAVDSELATLGLYTTKISGAGVNPFFASESRFAVSGAASQLLVCRLDGPSAAIVRRMISDAVETERVTLRGMAYIDARGTKEAGLVEGDQWLYNAATVGRRFGMPVVLDNGDGMFPPAYPMTEAAVYLGWYRESVFGPFTARNFRFQKGAIAVHIHSFSAASLRDPRQYWCAPLLAAGATCTMGNVYEPYLALTAHLDIFFDRLARSWNFAEAGYASTRVLSWMNTFIGDPLYRPFRGFDAMWDQWGGFRTGSRAWFAVQDPAQRSQALQKLAEVQKNGMMFEGLGLLHLSANEVEAAIAAFGNARKYSSTKANAVRAGIHEVIQLNGSGKGNRASALAKEQIEKYPDEPGVEILRALLPAIRPEFPAATNTREPQATPKSAQKTAP